MGEQLAQLIRDPTLAEMEVDEPGPGDHRPLDPPRIQIEPGEDPLGELAGRAAYGLGEDQGEAGREIAVILGPWRLEHHRRDAARGQIQDCGRRGAQPVAQIALEIELGIGCSRGRFRHGVRRKRSRPRAGRPPRSPAPQASPVPSRTSSRGASPHRSSSR